MTLSNDESAIYNMGVLSNFLYSGQPINKFIYKKEDSTMLEKFNSPALDEFFEDNIESKNTTAAPTSAADSNPTPTPTPEAKPKKQIPLKD